MMAMRALGGPIAPDTKLAHCWASLSRMCFSAESGPAPEWMDWELPLWDLAARMTGQSGARSGGGVFW